MRCVIFLAVGFSVDWWALGVLMFEMVSGRSPWEGIGSSNNPDQNTEDYLFQGNAHLPTSFPSHIIFCKISQKLSIVDAEEQSHETVFFLKNGMDVFTNFLFYFLSQLSSPNPFDILDPFR